MAHGGYRPGSGRKKGSRDGRPRFRRAPLPVDPDAQRALRAACADFCRDGRAWALLHEFAQSHDPARRAWALKEIINYGVGVPVPAEPAPVGKTPTELLWELFDEQRQISDGKQELPAGGDEYDGSKKQH